MANLLLPPPVSAGLILSYQCNASCRHCMYACSPRWSKEWISPQDLKIILGHLVRTIEPAPFGPESVTLSHGLHFTGGEPFLNFPLLCQAVAIADSLGIPSTFVETNGFWATNESETLRKLQTLKELGLKGIMISVNPFYLEYVPFDRTRRCVELSLEIFGQNTMVYQLEYFNRFLSLGIQGRLPLQEYFRREGKKEFLENVEFFMMGRAPFQMDEKMSEFFVRHPAGFYLYQPCNPAFLREWHNHVDNYGNYIPGFCGGLSLGNARRLPVLLNEGINLDEYPVLKYIVDNSFAELLDFAKRRGYKERFIGYFSKCHLCADIRRHLAAGTDFAELDPGQFYQHLLEPPTHRIH